MDDTLIMMGSVQGVLDLTLTLCSGHRRCSVWCYSFDYGIVERVSILSCEKLQSQHFSRLVRQVETDVSVQQVRYQF